jgi:hypothetical protein
MTVLRERFAKCGVRTLAGLAIVGLTSTACDRGPGPLPDMLRVEGCLTAEGDELVLTQLTPAGDVERTAAEEVPRAQATELYRLIGNDDELRPHVGQRVRVVGEAESPDVAIVRKKSPAGPAQGGTDGQVADADPRVSTMQKIRFEATDLEVRTVTALNEPCTP